MGGSTGCPNCDEEEAWSILATTPVGVRLPGDSDAALDTETRRELALCVSCGVCYDPIISVDVE
jgi:hypothetical protein